MEKHIELIKKIKALAERGLGGEAINAKNLLLKMLQKHNLTIEDIDGEKQEDYFFKAQGINTTLFHQIVKRVNYDLNVYHFPASKVKQFKLRGNLMVTCTPAEFIEIDQMFDVYTKLYKEESEIFYTAFLSANDLLTRPPKEKQKSMQDLTSDELEMWLRVNQMAGKIKKETIRKQLNSTKQQ